jgi:hypothetical protein
MADSNSQSNKSFWTTLPGILTGIAALVTALAALIGALSAAGILSPQPAATAGPTPRAIATDTPIPTPRVIATATPHATEASPFAFTFSPNPAKRGAEVEIRPSIALETATVYFNGRPLPKKVLSNGRVLVVTVPGDAESGYFELEWQGIRVRAADRLNVLP